MTVTQDNAPMRSPAFLRTLRGRLVVLTLAVLIPAILLSGLLLWSAQAQARRSIEGQLRETTQALALVVDRQLGEQASMLSALMTSPSFKAGDWPAFDRQVREVFPHVHTALVVVDDKGQQLINTRLSPGAPLPRTLMPTSFWAGTTKAGAKVSNLALGPVVRQQVIAVAREVRLDDGQWVRISITTLASEFGSVFKDQRLPATWTGALLDGSGAVISRSRDAEKMTGRRASPDILQALRTAPTGVIKSQTLDGIKTYSAFSKSPGYGWAILVGVPRSEIPVFAGPLRWAVMATVLLLLGVLLALRMGTRATRAVESLAQSARDWREGDPLPQLPVGGLAETDDLAKAFVGALERLANRDEALRASESRLKAALSQLNEANAELASRVDDTQAELDHIWRVSLDGFMIADQSGRWLRVSPAWTKILGWSEDELLGRNSEWLLHPDDIESTRAVIIESLMGRRNLPFENRLRTKDGGYRRLSWNAVAHEGLLYCVTRDVTAEREAAEELARAQVALRQAQKMDALGQLTGGVAHDFNNLLTPILGSLDMLSRRATELEDRNRRLVDGALQAAERAKILVQRLLAFARRQPLQATAVDLHKLVLDMSELVASTMGPRIEVVVKTAADAPPAKADRNQLELALLNLVVNARDAMPDGGALTITTDAPRQAEPPPPELEPGQYLRLSVHDTGAGMDEATLARAVEPFFSTKGLGKGTGLGLSMVHGLAAQLGGALRISSRPGLGTRIELWLPRAEPGVVAAEPGEVRRQEGVMTESGLVLLVDDEELVRASTAQMLSEMGYAVVEAESAGEALSLLDGGLDVQLVITDHLMPGMTGVELIEVLRRRKVRAPVLLASGYADVEGLAPDLPRLNKPFRQAELAAKLDEMLEDGAAL